MKTRLKYAAFAIAGAAILMLAWQGKAATAIVAGAFAIIAALTGIDIPI